MLRVLYPKPEESEEGEEGTRPVEHPINHGWVRGVFFPISSRRLRSISLRLKVEDPMRGAHVSDRQCGYEHGGRGLSREGPR